MKFFQNQRPNPLVACGIAQYSPRQTGQSNINGLVSAAHNLSSSVAHKLSGLKITREVIRDETNDSVTGGQEDEI